ncbi:MAG: NAD kinase [Cyclobacteriaceae bacterium]|nr:NAD kinase [Cyclobacteriaceae bacterium]
MSVPVAINGKPFDIEEKERIKRFLQVLKENDFIPILSKEFADTINKKVIPEIKGLKVYKSSSDLKNVKFAFSLGGDGTLLETLTHVGKLEIPIIGINMGRLGFLATTPLEDIEKAVESLALGDFELDERALLQMNSDLDAFKVNNFALNDFTILKRDTSSMIKVKVYLNEIYLNTYWADGLIISTPTGSTGYSLSCGGPLVLPKSNNFIITPVSPHNLNARPLVVSDSSKISFKIEARSENVLVSLDSRSMSVPTNIKISIKRSALRAKLVKFSNYNQLRMMRKKLKWGIDYRN